MKLVSFRIENFRSIVDTGWCNFSPDNVTVLVGQNESGKTSIIEALSATFSSLHLSNNDCRISYPLPLITIRVKIDWQELRTHLEEDNSTFPEEQLLIAENYLNGKDGILDLAFRWEKSTAPNSKMTCVFDIIDKELQELLAPYARNAAEENSEKKKQYDTTMQQEVTKEIAKASQHGIQMDKASAINLVKSRIGNSPSYAAYLESKDIASAIINAAPNMILFQASSGLLPDRIDIIQNKEGNHELSGDGNIAAKNFLQIAGVNLNELVNGDIRTRENILKRANTRVTTDFAKFWSQTIGKREKLQLECDITNYGTDKDKLIGKPHLVFWISDGLNKLYPKQRSQGVRWFVSFYLQLKASEMEGEKSIFLLDEPGANLHSKAQEDVLRLINKLSDKTGIIYSTHSPHLIEYEKLFRVLAVQREAEEGDSPTTVIDAHKLGAASRDTLSPLFTAMGVDLSHQQVVQKKNNVLLEEISGFYYLKTFWKLTGQKQDAYFIAATGADNVEPLANMFLGWGLEFIIVLDDDPHGRSAYNKLKRHIYGDDEASASSNMLKIHGARGIEDVFSKSDFKKYILDASHDYDQINSDYVKDMTLSKPILAYRFSLRVKKDEIKLGQFDEETRGRITELVDEITKRLSQKTGK